MSAGGRRVDALNDLAALLADPGQAVLPSTPSRWALLIDGARAHGLGPALWVALRDAGRATHIPADARSWMRGREAGLDAPLLALEDAYDANVAHLTKLLALARLVTSALPAGAVAPLKGLHTLVTDLWDDPGARSMVDLDVLAAPGTAGDVFDVLRAAGLAELPDSLGEFADHQLPVLRDGDGACIEVHTHVLRQRWAALLPADDVFAASIEVDSSIGRCAVMSATHAVVVLVAHGQLQDDTFRRLEIPLRALHETDRWIRSGGAVDWDEVERRFEAIGQRRVLRSHLESATAWFGTQDPLRGRRDGRTAGRGHALATRVALRASPVHGAYNYLQYLPRSFHRDRMVAEYGAPHGRAWLTRVRLRHVTERVAARVWAGGAALQATPPVRGVRRRARRARFSSYVQVDRDWRSTVLLVGSGRSGTTWLAQVLAGRPGCRLIFEPFRAGAVREARGFVEGEFVPPGTQDPGRRAAAVGILSGHVRSRWTDRLNHSHLVTSRVVKCIRINNLVPWFQHEFEELRIVYLLRHPCAVALSRIHAAFRDQVDNLRSLQPLCDGPLAPYAAVIERVAEHGTRFDREVLGWCMQNRVTLTLARPDLAVFLFEDLVLEPERELARLATAARWPMGRRAHRALARTQGYGAREATKAAVRVGRVDGWLDAVDLDARRRADELLIAFDLHHLYSGLDPLPRVEGAEVLRGA